MAAPDVAKQQIENAKEPANVAHNRIADAAGAVDIVKAAAGPPARGAHPPPKLYGRRFGVMLVQSAASGLSAFYWITFATPFYQAQEFFGGVDALSINAFSMIYFIAYPFGSVLGLFLNENYGLRTTLLLACGCLSAAGWIRVIGAFLPSATAALAVCLVGQVVAGIGQPLLLNQPAKIANDWFGASERELATTAMAMANVVGNALGAFVPAIQVQNANDIPWMLLWQAIPALAILAAAALVAQDRPPTPPTAAVAWQLASRRQMLEGGAAGATGVGAAEKHTQAPGSAASAGGDKGMLVITVDGMPAKPHDALVQVAAGGAVEAKAAPAGAVTVVGRTDMPAVGVGGTRRRTSSIGIAATDTTHDGARNPVLMLMPEHRSSTVASDLGDTALQGLRLPTATVGTAAVRLPSSSSAGPPTADIKPSSMQVLRILTADFRALLTNRKYCLLLAAFALEVGMAWAFLTIMSQMIVPCGYSAEAAGAAGAALLGAGALLSLLVSPVLERSRAYIAFQKIFLVLSTAACIWCLGVNSPGNIGLVMAAWLAFGGFVMPLIPITLSHAAEVTFPVPADSSAALLLLAANLLSMVLTFLLTPLLALPVSAECTSIYTPAAGVVLGFMLVGAIITLPMKADYRRSAAEAAQKQQEV